MTASAWMLLFLSVIGVCMVLITVTVMSTARDVRRTLRRLYEILPSFERAAREVSSTFARTRGLITKAHALSAVMEGVTERASTVLHTAMQAWHHMKRRTQQWVEHSFGKQNGTRGDPRRHVRGS